MVKKIGFIILALFAFGLAVRNIALANDEVRMESYGIVSSFPPNMVGNWVISDHNFEATASTQFDTLDGGPFEVGGCAKVRYDAITQVVYEISSEPINDCVEGDDDNEMGISVYGTLGSLPDGLIGDWVVDGVTYTTTANTEFDPMDIFVVGACVKVELNPTTLAVYEIEAEGADDCVNGQHDDDDDDDNDLNTIATYGLLEQFPADYLGTWQLSGTIYTATNATQFNVLDTFVLGNCVKIEYYPDTFLAHEIELENEEDCTTPQTDSNFINGNGNSTFALRGAGFAPQSAVKVLVDGAQVGTVSADSFGTVNFGLRFGALPSRTTNQTVQVTLQSGTLSNAQPLTITELSPTRQLPSGFSGPVVNAAQVPTAVTMLSANTPISSALPLLILTLALFSVVTFIGVRRQQHAQ